MSVNESLAVSLFCMVLVFFVLACLFGLIKVLSSILDRIADKRAGISAARAEAETAASKGDGDGNRCEVSTGELKLINVNEKTAAMIMAIVSHESQIPLSELSFKSIKAIEKA